MKQQLSLQQKNNDNPLNLKPNVSNLGSIIYFQIGLVLSLLAVLYLLEYESQIVIISPPFFSESPIKKDELVPLTAFKLETPKLVKQETPKRKSLDPNLDIEPKLLKNEIEAKVILKHSTDETLAKPLSPEEVINVESNPDENIVYNMITVSRAPVYPGCESCKTNKELIRCFSQKINKLFNRHFNYSIVEDHNLSGRQMIAIKFIVNKKGQIQDIMAKSKQKVLSDEASRIIAKMPNLKPAIQGDHTVNVAYTLPIRFVVD